MSLHLSCSLSVLNIGLLLSALDTNNFLVGDKDLFFAVQLELVINRLRLELLYLILVQNTTLNLSEVPSDKEGACRGDNRAFFATSAEIIEFGGFEVNAADPVLGDVSGFELELERVGFLLAHTVLKASLVVGAHRGDAQQVRLRGGQNPQTVAANLYCLDWVTQAWKQSLCVLSDLLVQANLTIIAAKGKLASHGGSHRAEHWVSLVGSFGCDTGL